MTDLMKDPWNRATKKLIDLTESGAIEWKPTEAVAEVRSGDAPVVGPPYVAEAGNKRIAVYELRTAVQEEDGGIHFYRDTYPVIEFVDEEFRRQWTWPVASSLAFELLETIRYQTSDADSFLKTFLADRQPA